MFSFSLFTTSLLNLLSKYFPKHYKPTSEYILFQWKTSYNFIHLNDDRTSPIQTICQCGKKTLLQNIAFLATQYHSPKNIIRLKLGIMLRWKK